MSLLYDLFSAYESAKRGKKSSQQLVEREMDRETHLVQLYHDLHNQSYQIGTSACFIYTDTVPREIFAASFRDRIVHHVIYRYLYPSFDRRFIYDSYSCRLGKGTQLGWQRVDHFVRSCSRQYTQECYILKCDIQSFFMSISRDILRTLLCDHITKYHDTIPCDTERLLRLVELVVYHDPTQDYIIKGSPSDWDSLPRSKSLFSAKLGYGLPIGNLTSQLFANVYMDVFDRWMVYDQGCRYYGRYVDDFVVVHPSREYLLDLVRHMTTFLSEKLDLTLHPDKIYLQPYTKGVKFCGAMIVPYRHYLDRRTIARRRKAMSNSLDKKSDNIQSMMNSYLGLLGHHAHHAFTQSQLHEFGALYPDYSITAHGFVSSVATLSDDIHTSDPAL